MHVEPCVKAESKDKHNVTRHEAKTKIISYGRRRGGGGNVLNGAAAKCADPGLTASSDSA